MYSMEKGLKLPGLILAVFLIFLGLGLLIKTNKTVVLELDGHARSLQTKAVTIGGLLEEQGIRYNGKDCINPCPEELLKPGSLVSVKLNAPVEITVDGVVIKTEDYENDPRELAEKAGIYLGPLDRVEGTVNKDKLPVKLKVVRVVELIGEEEEIIPFQEERVLDPELPRGQTKLIQKGETGIGNKRYLLHWENGLLTQNRTVAVDIIKEPRSHIAAWGIKDSVTVAGARSLAKPQKSLQLKATAYTHTGNPTYTGVYPQVGTIAVDPKVIPLGSHMWVEGYGYGIALDTGGLIKGHRIDLFMDSERQCRQWGVRDVTVYLLQ